MHHIVITELKQIIVNNKTEIIIIIKQNNRTARLMGTARGV